jgi:hypothetical protein
MMKIKSLKQFNFKLQALLLCGICSGGILSSCSSEDIGNKTGSEIGKQLVLTITTDQPGSRATSGTNLTVGTDDKAESQINRLTVGVFDGTTTGNPVRTIQEYTLDGTNKFTQPDAATTKATVTTTSLAAGDKVLVAVNAPSKLFSSVQKLSDFVKSIDADRALATSWDATNKQDAAAGTSEAINNIPMYGEAAIVAGGSDSYSSAVQVLHQVAKITVQTVGVDFDPNGPYSAATFQPTAFFLTNVPSNLNYTTTAATGSLTVYQGGDASATTTYKAYLGTGDLGTAYTALKGIKGASTASVDIKKFFYTMPNNVPGTNTKLVIEGKFSPDGITAPTTVYYPVNINWVYGGGAAPDGGTAKTVSPNKNYVCSITIKTKGATSPTQSIDPSAASLTVTVKGFDEADQTTIFE